MKSNKWIQNSLNQKNNEIIQQKVNNENDCNDIKISNINHIKRQDFIVDFAKICIYIYIFSKLKLMKSYFRSIELVIFSIEKWNFNII